MQAEHTMLIVNISTRVKKIKKKGLVPRKQPYINTLNTSPSEKQILFYTKKKKKKAERFSMSELHPVANNHFPHAHAHTHARPKSTRSCLRGRVFTEADFVRRAGFTGRGEPRRGSNAGEGEKDGPLLTSACSPALALGR